MASILKIRKNYEPSRGGGTSFEGDPGRTKQAFKAECDVNVILARYAKTGALPDLIKRNPQYGDFSNVPDYQASLNAVEKAREQFMALPSKVRTQFGNDPGQFLVFASDPKNGQALVDMGLATPRVASEAGGGNPPPTFGNPPISNPGKSGRTSKAGGGSPPPASSSDPDA